MKNYYEILGVDEKATQDDIKKAYRKLSKQYHPDVNPDGEEKFKDIAEAYDNIGDEQKRRNYDNMKNNPFANMGGGDGFHFNDIFEQMMNGHRQPQRAPDKVITVKMTPFDSYFGAHKEIVLDNFTLCVPCDGSGGDKKVCESCNGNGFKVQIMGTGMFKQQFRVQCNLCGGQGSKTIRVCNSCSGSGLKKENEKLMVTIPQNVDNGDFMRVKGKGDFNPQVRLRGDLILKVEMEYDENYEKVGFDLITKLKLSPLDMLLEDKLIIKHPDGDLSIKIPSNIDTDKPLRIPNKGYKTPNGNGHCYIKLSVNKTEDLNDDIKNKLRDILKQPVN
jgi:molecular chaperone DnaJ